MFKKLSLFLAFLTIFWSVVIIKYYQSEIRECFARGVFAYRTDCETRDEFNVILAYLLVVDLLLGTAAVGTFCLGRKRNF